VRGFGTIGLAVVVVVLISLALVVFWEGVRTLRATRAALIS